MPYKLRVSDREYTDISILCSKTLQKIDTNIDSEIVLRNKLFNQDIFEYDSVNESCSILHSSIRSMPVIPAVLVLEGKRTFGKWKNSKKQLYKCVPDDRRLPIFFVPYLIKKSFNKHTFNKYIVVKFNNWNKRHPIATIVQTVGDVTILNNFYEYQLYCKSLYASIQKFTKTAMVKLKKQSSTYFINKIIAKYKIEDRQDWSVFTIDPIGSKDFDDGLSIRSNGTTTTLSIYIANVSFWLDTLELWDSFTKRIATIYLPDRKRPMLPTILSDALCSLQENEPRFAFTLDIELNNTTYEINKISWSNTLIKVKKNLRYDTSEQENYPGYKRLFVLVQLMNRQYKYLDTIHTSHDVIAYCMIIMNYLSAKKLLQFKTGIFRGIKLNQNFTPPANVTANVSKFLKMWNSSGANYVKFENLLTHDVLELDAYVHITSPIRRLIDILTMLILQKKLGLLEFNNNIQKFYDRWTNDEALEYINTTMRSIRKVQNDCSLLKLCSVNENILNMPQVGYIFDKIERNDKLFQYMVYLPKLKIVNRFTSRYEKDNNSVHKFRLYLFTDEHQLKRKIRIEVDSESTTVS